jgi:hypothetical protein
VNLTTTPAPGTPDALDAQLKSLADEAASIVDTVDAAAREFTTDEADRIRSIFDEAKSLRRAREKASERIELRDQIGGLVSAEEAKALNGAATKGRVIEAKEVGQTPGERFANDENVKAYLGQWPNGIPDSSKGIRTPPVHFGGIKQLISSGETLADTGLVRPQWLGLQDPIWGFPLRLRQLVTGGTTNTDSIEYARVLSTTNSAAPVAEATTFDGTGLAGGVKPLSGMAFERVTTPVRTIAHWMAATKRALADFAQLRTLIDGFLRFGLEEVLEAQILSGDGTGDNLLGILNTPGILAQPFDTDILTTIRRAITAVQMEYTAMPPTAIVLNPADEEALDLLRNDGGDFLAGAMAPWTGTTPRTVWGLTRVVSHSMPQGTALVGAFNAAVLWDRQVATLSATDTHDDFFIRNLIAILAELRAAFGVLRPASFVEVDLGGGGGGNGNGGNGGTGGG